METNQISSTLINKPLDSEEIALPLESNMDTTDQLNSQNFIGVSDLSDFRKAYSDIPAKIVLERLKEMGFGSPGAWDEAWID